MAESHPMNGGDGKYSYTKNSHLQRAATSVAKTMIDDAIAEKLDTTKFSSTSENTFRIADLGCSVGPNTFIAMQNILDAVQQKYQSHGLTSSHMPKFHVFFNDHASNDFNTLFATLPPERPYFAAGVPGSFYGQLFPDSSLHIVHSSYALQWLSKVPEELLNKDSPAWNKGRVHYTSAPDEVAAAYASQFDHDMTIFLNSRAKELVVGGMMVLIMPAIPDGIPNSRVPSGVMFDFLGSSLMDMAKQGLISEAQVDSFNLPVYAASVKEMTKLVERNGYFSIESMEITNPAPKSSIDGPINGQACTMHIRAGMEGIISKHFGTEIIDELFVRFYKKTEEFYHLLESSYREGTQFFIVLKRLPPDGIPHSIVPMGVMSDFLGSSLMNMAKQGLISEAQVDSFNLPVYVASSKEMTRLVERNGYFSIETVEVTSPIPLSRLDNPFNGHESTNTKHLRAILEGIISKHFGTEIIDEFFVRVYKKTEEFPYLLNSCYKEGTQFFIVLKRV